MLEVDFKPNSTPQNRLVSWNTPLIYYKTVLSLVDMELPTNLEFCLPTYSSKQSEVLLIRGLDSWIQKLKYMFNSLILFNLLLEFSLFQWVYFLEIVGSFTLIRDKLNLQYVNRCKSHLTKWFCKIELDLKFTF